MKKTITAKKLEELLKKGEGSEFLEGYYEMPIEQIEGEIRKSLSKNAAQRYIQRIKNNDKRQRKIRRNENIADETIAEKIIADEIIADETIADEIIADEIIADETIAEIENNIEKNEAENIQQEDKVLKLKSEIEELYEKLSQAELKHKSYMQERTSIRNDLQKSWEVLKALKEKMIAEDLIVQALLEKIEVAGKKMAEINETIREFKDGISIKEEQVKEYEKISLLVYNSGEIEFSKIAEIPVEWEKIYKAFSEDERLGDFTGNQLRGLAKVIALKEKGLTIDVVFECEELNTLYKESQV